MLYLILTLFTAPISSAATFEELRAGFQKAEVPFTQEMEKGVWDCTSKPAFGDRERGADGKLFEFLVVPHNKNIIFNNLQTIPAWVPRWFSAYQGMRTSIAFWTNDFLTDCQSGDLNACLTEEKVRKNFGYLRLDKQDQLWIEWTTQNNDALETKPLSVDSDEPDQKVWMYTHCSISR